MSELAKCPFCKGAVAFHLDEKDCPDGCHYIHCPQCKVMFEMYAADPGNTCETREGLRAEIAGHWNSVNRRAASGPAGNITQLPDGRIFRSFQSTDAASEPPHARPEYTGKCAGLHEFKGIDPHETEPPANARIEECYMHIARQLKDGVSGGMLAELRARALGYSESPADRRDEEKP